MQDAWSNGGWSYVGKLLATAEYPTLMGLFTSVGSNVNGQGTALDEALATVGFITRVGSFVGMDAMMSLQIRLAIETLRNGGNLISFRSLREIDFRLGKPYFVTAVLWAREGSGGGLGGKGGGGESLTVGQIEHLHVDDGDGRVGGESGGLVRTRCLARWRSNGDLWGQR